MKLLQRLPLYATGVGFAALLLVVADVRNWSDLTFFLVALGIALFYTAMILVPWLIREQWDEADASETKGTFYRADFDLIPRNGANGAGKTVRTHGLPIAGYTPPRVTTP